MMKMDSPLSGSNDRELIAISTPYFEMYIKGRVKSPKYCTKEDEALYEVSCLDEVELAIFEMNQEVGTMIQKVGKPQFFEQTPYQVIIEKKEDCVLQFDHDSTLLRKSVTPVGKTGHLLTGILQFGNEVGLTDLRVLVNGQSYLKVTLEIYPSKLSYKADYLKMREDIAQEVYNLAFDFMKRTYINASITETKKPSLTEFFSIFQQQFTELMKVTHQIVSRPYHELVEVSQIKCYQISEQITPKGIRYLNKRPHHIMQQGESYLPQKVLQVKKQMTVDVYENRIIKYMLEQMIARLKHLQKQYSNLSRQMDEKVMGLLHQWLQALEQKVQGPFFRKISKINRMHQFSIVLQMSPSYKQFYRMYLLLQKGLSITTDVFQISQKDVAQLYEYWCFIKLGSLLRKNHTLISNDVIKVKSNELFVSLQKGKASTLKYRNDQTGEVLTLVYNQKLKSMPTVSQAPDNMLVLEKEMSDVVYHYVLDAKYKMNYERVEGHYIEVPKEEDINTMHRYRDAIVARSGHKPYERKVFGSVILFPGNDEEVYKAHRFYKSIESVNIGGLPFLPSQTTLVEVFLERLIEGTSQTPYHNLPKIVGWQEYNETLDVTTQDVLLGPVKSKEQLETTLREKIYYVPAKKVNLLNKQIKQVALYEPKGIGTLKTGGISYIGKVAKISQQPRKNLQDLFPTSKAHVDETYIIFQIESWHQREIPIVPCGYGVSSPWYSNRTLLKYAKTLPELHIKDSAELELILNLRRRVNELETRLDAAEHFIIQIGKNSIYINEKQEIVITCDGKIKIFPKELLQHDPRAIYRALGEERIIME